MCTSVHSAVDLRNKSEVKQGTMFAILRLFSLPSMAVNSSSISVVAPGVSKVSGILTGQPSHHARQLTILSKAAGVVTATGMHMNKTRNS